MMTACWMGKVKVAKKVTTMSRVIMIAVNMEVSRPMESVTAKPLTGPEPNSNRMMAANRVVRLASIMVVKAR